MNAAKRLLALACIVSMMTSTTPCFAESSPTAIARTALELRAAVVQIEKVEAALDAALRIKSNQGTAAIVTVSFPILCAAVAILLGRLPHVTSAPKLPRDVPGTIEPFSWLTSPQTLTRFFGHGVWVSSTIPLAMTVGYLTEDQITGLQEKLRAAKARKLAALEALQAMGVDTNGLVTE